MTFAKTFWGKILPVFCLVTIFTFLYYTKLSHSTQGERQWNIYVPKHSKGNTLKPSFKQWNYLTPKLEGSITKQVTQKDDSAMKPERINSKKDSAKHFETKKVKTTNNASNTKNKPKQKLFDKETKLLVQKPTKKKSEYSGKKEFLQPTTANKLPVQKPTKKQSEHSGKKKFIQPTTTTKLPVQKPTKKQSEHSGKNEFIQPTTTTKLPVQKPTKKQSEHSGKKEFIQPTTANKLPVQKPTKKQSEHSGKKEFIQPTTTTKLPVQKPTKKQSEYSDKKELTQPTTTNNYVTNEKAKSGKSNKCPVKWNTELNQNLTPLLNIDREKFLLPTLINGPNNQLVGFRKAIYIAIELNRTIVVPRFFKHRIGSDISAWHRVDLNQLAHLLPIISMEEYRKKCANTADAILLTRIMSYRAYKRVEQEIKITLVDESTGDLFDNIIEYPIDKTQHKQGNGMLIFDSAAILEMYSTNKRCAVHPFHFTNLRIRAKKPIGRTPSSIDFFRISDVDLYSEIIRFTPFPNHIKYMASEFLKRVLGNRKYLGVHWRYNKEDWMLSCTQNRAPQARMEMCANILKIDASQIAEGLASKMTVVGVTDVYVASPPSQQNVLKKVKKHLKDKYNFKMYYTSDVMEVWKKKYESCDWLWSDVNDLLSSTEMEICSRALVFLRSAASTWSNNVHLARSENNTLVKLDGGVYEIVMKAKEKNANSGAH